MVFNILVPIVVSLLKLFLEFPLVWEHAKTLLSMTFPQLVYISNNLHNPSE
jgi:hypothetical protein